MRKLFPLVLSLLAALAAAQAPSPTPGPPKAGGTKRRATPEVVLAPSALVFAPLGPGQVSPGQAVLVKNVSGVGVTVTSVSVAGLAPADFAISSAPALPLVLGPASSASVSVLFHPTAKGPRSALLRVAYTVGREHRVATASLAAVGLGAAGEELNVNCGGFTYTDTHGVGWSADFGTAEGAVFTNLAEIKGTSDDPLYRSYRTGAPFAYSLPLPPGGYAVTLHFAEPTFAAPGARVFDVGAEGKPIIDDLDLAAAAGLNTAYTSKHFVAVPDGALDLAFSPSVGQAIISAIEVESSPVLATSPEVLDFGALASGTSSSLPLTVINAGSASLHLSELALLLGESGTTAAFTVSLGGNVYPGGGGDVSYPLSLSLPPGGALQGSVAFAPTLEQLDVCRLRLASDGGTLKLPVTGLGGHAGHPFLHVVSADPGLLVDYEGDGHESVILDGSQSHTHFPGGSLVGYSWTEDGLELASAPVAVRSFPTGAHEVELTITDDTVPPESLTDHLSFEVHPKTAVPGVVARYFQATGGTAGALLQSVPAQADFAELLGALEVDGGAHIGSSPFTQNTLVVLKGKLALPAAGTYRFAAAGGSQRLLLVDGVATAGWVTLAAGAHSLEARFAVDTAGQQPLRVLLAVNGGGMGPIDPSWLTHDQSGFLPVINSMPSVGTNLGGNLIAIHGQGFFPFANVVVHWGSKVLSGAALSSVTASEIRFFSPPGSGQIAVTVATPQGTSKPWSFVYDAAGPVPIKFVSGGQTSVTKPTTGDWGPDGRFYVGSVDGRLTAIEYDEHYSVISKVTYPGVSSQQCKAILGLAFNPHDPPGLVRVYVSHTELFAKGGSSFSGPAAYTSQISILEGPAFNVAVPLVTHLPTSNHDHGVNGMFFDHNGDLLFCVGGNTNAGIKWPTSGDLPESPFSGALVKARTSLGAGFNGNLTYVDSLSGIASADQVLGELVDPGGQTNVFVYAPGLRNPYDAVLTTAGRIYATDNGPNSGFGPASTGAASIDPTQPQQPDELNLVRPGVYYGHPNRNRGRYFPTQNVYRGPLAPSQPGEFRQALVALPSSTDGIAEYRSRTFQGQMRGDLIVQKYGSNTRRVDLSADGESVLSVSLIDPFTGGLDVTTGPGGALLSADHNGDRIMVLVPDDASALGLVVQDVTPWRAPASGGARFVVGGVGFGTLADTTVRFGGVTAALLSVAPNRIVGFVPASASPTSGLIDLSVTVGAQSDTLPAAFRYLCLPGCELGTWQPLPSLPHALGEVAAGVVGGKLYALGEGDGRTVVFDLAAGQWMADAASRPLQGHHHGAEVLGGKLYLIGGLGGGSNGKVQIYDPATNSWSLGAPMPWAGGSVSTALIQGRIYAAGGIVGTSTVKSAGAYDPVANTWTMLAPMPVGRNHTAAGTDGRRFFIFGGRSGDNVVSNGFDDVQVYDPMTNTWAWDKDGVSQLAPLPQYRGGMGKAVFFEGEFFVFGGETLTGPGALPAKVYDRVDVYDPVENAWRLDTPLLNPRHGIFPLLYEGAIYLPGGGVQAGNSQSTVFDVFERP